MFFFCLLAFSSHIFLHESAHYLGAKHANLEDPQIHYASTTVKDNITLGTPEETISQYSLVDLIIWEASGPFLTTTLTLVSIILLMRKYNDFVFIFGLVPLTRSYTDVCGLFTGQIFGDELYVIRLLSYYTPWWDNRFFISSLFLILIYIEFSINFYIIIAYSKKRNVWEADYLVTFPDILFYPVTLVTSIINSLNHHFRDKSQIKDNKMRDEVLRILSIFLVILFWNILWMTYIGPKILP